MQNEQKTITNKAFTVSENLAKFLGMEKSYYSRKTLSQGFNGLLSVQVRIWALREGPEKLEELKEEIRFRKSARKLFGNLPIEEITEEVRKEYSGNQELLDAATAFLSRGVAWLSAQKQIVGEEAEEAEKEWTTRAERYITLYKMGFKQVIKAEDASAWSRAAKRVADYNNIQSLHARRKLAGMLEHNPVQILDLVLAHVCVSSADADESYVQLQNHKDTKKAIYEDYQFVGWEPSIFCVLDGNPVTLLGKGEPDEATGLCPWSEDFLPSIPQAYAVAIMPMLEERLDAAKTSITNACKRRDVHGAGQKVSNPNGEGFTTFGVLDGETVDYGYYSHFWAEDCDNSTVWDGKLKRFVVTQIKASILRSLRNYRFYKALIKHISQFLTV